MREPAAAAHRKLLLGLIGAGIQRSLTPAMQEEEARAHGLKLHYQLIDLDLSGAGVAALPTLISAARWMGFAGLNITYPCKQAVIPLLDELSEEARAIGAVNTIVNRGGKLIGHNTDGSGWAWGFRRALPGADLSQVVLLGAGGAGSAIAHAVLRLGAARLVIVDREEARAHELAQRLNAEHGPGARAQGAASGASGASSASGTSSAPRVSAGSDPAAALRGATGLIHATPTGMDKFPGLPLPEDLLRPDLWVAEIVYFPIETALLKAARARGCATLDGGTMAVGQAIGAFELFTGRQADPARVEVHFRRLIAPLSAPRAGPRPARPPRGVK
ncbi:MAG: shikimate dehydrogenase [Burkholderiaceae bacterium]